MSVPGIVESSLDGEEIAARISLGGEDELYVTATRTLIYRGDGLLSDESVEEYDHDAERLSIAEGRRKTRFSLEYPLDGTKEFTLPAKHADEAVHPILAGMLNAGGVTEPGEAVLHSYRFSELTLVITSNRIVKHIGEAVWDNEYEEFPFEGLTGIAFEEGEHATQFVLEVDGRPERIKTPNDEAPRVREHLKQALFDFYDVRSMDELRAEIEPDTDEDSDDEPEDSNVDFGEGVDPLEANPPASGMDPSAQSATEELTDDRFDRSQEDSSDSSSAQRASQSTQTDRVDPTEQSDAQQPAPTDDPATGVDDRRQPTDADTDPDQSEGGQLESDEAAADTDTAPLDQEVSSDPPATEELAAAGFEPADDGSDEVHAELEELRAAVEKQNKLLARQQQTIEQLIEELRRGR